MLVTLTWQEIRLAAEVGVTRRIVSMRDNRLNAAGYRGNEPWDVDILGAMGEVAVAKALCLYWSPSVNTFKLPDVGDLHVRATRYGTGKLIVRPNDPDGTYLLVIALLPKFKIVGYCSAQYAKQDEFRSQPDSTRPSCWAVPQSRLAQFSWMVNAYAQPQQESAALAN